MGKNKGKTGIVFSTNPDYSYQFENEHTEQETLPPQQQNLIVMLDKKKRSGKAVTLVTRFTGTHEDLDELAPAYAATVHKSQGSEYPAVVIPVLPQHFLLLQRNVIYTAVTRAKKVCVIIGARKSLVYAIHNNQTMRRNTRLAERLRHQAAGGSE